MKLVTEYPVWFLVFCLAAGLVYAFALYFKERKNEFSDNLVKALMVIRFVTISTIAFLLLSPLLKSVHRRVEKPVIILAQDNSQSLIVNKDSAFYKTAYLKDLTKLQDELGRDYDIQAYSFGEALREKANINYSEKQTNISSFLEDLQVRYAHRNVGALILATDGIYNMGSNPVFSSEMIKFPIYTLALGDTSHQKDLVISRVSVNKIAYLGNNFPMEILVTADKLKGKQTDIQVLKEGKPIYSKPISISADRYSETIRLQIEAKETGIQRFQIRLGGIPGEITMANNEKNVFVEVLEAKEKILILTGAPHPDIAAIKAAIESNFAYEVTVDDIDDFKDPVEKFNVIILNQLPSINAPAANIISRADKAAIPMLFIIGANTDLRLLNSLKIGVNILSTKNTFNESQPSLNSNFSLFTISEETKRTIDEYPPLDCPFATYSVQNSANVALFQKIGSLATDRPLLLFNQDLNRKTGVLCGEGLWKWRLAEYAKKNTHSSFNELFIKSMQFLSVKMNRNFFRIEALPAYFDNEPLNFSAEVYNQTYELINDPDVEMIITNEQNKSFTFVFSKSEKGYYLNAGLLPVGNYKFSAKVRVGEKIYQEKGDFAVVPQNIESVMTIADHNLLYKLAAKHGGEMVYPASMLDLVTKLKNRDDIKRIIYTEKRFNDLVNLPLALVFIILMLSLEWLLRKRAGSY